MTISQLNKQSGSQNQLTDEPLVSIFTCVHKTRPEFLCKTVESILGQGYSNWEYLIIDTCPQDTRKHIIEPYLSDPRIKYEIAPRKIKFYQGANLIIPKLKGKYVGCLDHDDIRYKDNLSTIVAYMEEHPDYGFVGGGVDIDVDKKLRDQLRECIMYPQSDIDIRTAMLNGWTPMLHSVMLMRRDVIDLLAPNYYKAAYNLCPENQLYFRLVNKTMFYNIQKVLGLYRYYSGNSSTNQAQEQWRQYYALWNKFKNLI